MTDKTDGLEVVAYMLECPSMTGGTTWKLSWSKSGAGVCVPLNGDAHKVPLVALASAQAAVAAREQYHNAYVEGVLESYAELRQRITQLEAALVVARDALDELHSSSTEKYLVAIAAIDSVGVTKT